MRMLGRCPALLPEASLNRVNRRPRAHRQTYGWSYGPGGRALRGRTLEAVVTAPRVDAFAGQWRALLEA
ncbi:MAG: hypothetical protein GZ089_07875 [Aromatoleum sp.]|nr:hypothetical protein [Aromatoleum sp.]